MMMSFPYYSTKPTVSTAVIWQETSDNDHYPSEKLVKDSLDAKENAANKVSSFRQTPDDSHYPTEKLVKDSLDALQDDIDDSATVVVNELPAIADAKATVNYILRSGDSGLLYKKINGAWMLVGGSKVQVLASLPATGDEMTDYYVPNASGIYIHYRWVDGDPSGTFFAIGADGYTKSEVDTVLAAKENTANKATSWGQTPSDTKYPSEKLVKDSLDAIDTVSSVVVSTLPAVANANANYNYILKKGSGALLFRVIDGVWKMVGGAMVSVVTTLPQVGDSSTDYYVGDDTGVYLHYRWMDAYEDNGETVAAHFYAVGSDAYSKTEIDSKLTEIRNTQSTSADTLGQSIASIGRALESTNQRVSDLEDDQRSYSAAITQDGDTYYLDLVENEETVVSHLQLPATGGGGGGNANTTLTVERITASPVIATPTDRIVLEIDFSSVDGDNETVDGSYVLRNGNTVIMSGSLNQGRNQFDVTDYCTIGTQKFNLTVTDDGGSSTMKSWTVQVVDVRIESAFSDRYTNAVGRAVNFTYTPYGSISKTVHFKLDSIELDPVVTNASGILQSYTIPAQSHGAHLLEVWITASVNGKNIETDHIYKDIIWFDSELDAPVIGCIYRYDHYGVLESKQYNTASIPYVVYDPRTETPTVELRVDGVLVNTLHLTTASNVWSFKSDDIGVHVLAITCRTTTLTLRVEVTELGYNITPITANLAFDFNPSGMSNSGANRLWEDSTNNDVKLSVSENFDWENGGYQTDADGNQYFCVKSGTRAYISHNLFGINPKQDGAEFKIVFKTENVRDKDATFLTCLATDELDKAGLRMRVHEADVYTSSDTLVTPYSEEDVIEFEYNINAINTEDANATSFIMSYEDGVAARPILYPNDSGYLLHQLTPVPITIGSDDCDVHIYRMKAYTSALSDSDILANFIADSRDSDTMIARYERNQIYNENNELTPESVAAACPNLKVIKIDCPHFTNDKNNYVRNTNVECIHRNGDPVLDNWKFTNMYHAGQGTTSNRYGLAGRNIDIIGGFDGEHQVVSKISAADSTGYVTEVTLGDGTKRTGAEAKIALTRTSVPNNWFNIKVNIASSENANNALLQKRYNDYLPYQTPAQKRDPRIKNSMEFVNCVVFIKETDPDLSTHREFADNNWHFYALGNIGDSKKTDNTRVNDPTDLAEFVVEISDNTLPNSTFDTGVYYDENGDITYDPEEAVLNENLDIPSKVVYPITQTQWQNANNTKRVALYDDWDGSFEFRYDMGTKDGETITSAEIEAQQELSKQVFRDMYEWVITSSDANFVAQFSNWFITESMLYWYLFTERYTMIDNRSKNSFWHWGKTYITEAEAEEMGDDAENYIVDNAAAAINSGYRFDLWDYDNDTALGIDNNGELNMTYGHEDVDYKTDGDPSSGYIFNAADSVIWRRIRQLMGRQLRTMYQSRETMNCWSASSLIAEFDAWQEQFPEELWRLDVERKYLRPYYTGNPVGGIAATSDFLKNMMNGRKRYQRRQFERNQEVYIGTKYFGTNQCSDSEAISFRCNTPQSAVVRPNYTLRIVPYSDMYLAVAYGNSSPQQVRAKAGQEYVFTTALTSMDDTQILVYCAPNIQALNDLSACYIRANNFAYATRLKTLIIGSTVEGYSNPFITELSIGNNRLLETLDIRNCPNLTGTLNLSACTNLERLYAEGTSVTSVSFATNGKIRLAHLPETITSLTLRYLNYLTDLTLAGYSNLISLICEYCGFDPYTLVNRAIGTLQILTVLGIDWTFADTSFLNRIYAMSSSLLSGEATVTGSIRSSEIEKYGEKWKDLELHYNSANIIPQFAVTYKNANGTTLYETLIDRGSYPIDPVSSGFILTPTIPSDNQYVYTFSGWDDLTTPVTAAREIIAVYSTAVRSYTVEWYLHNGDMEAADQTTVTYGSEAVYSGDYPVDTNEETSGVYKIFIGWDKSTGYITGNTKVYATWQTGSLPNANTDLSEMTPVEMYAVSKNQLADSRYEIKDHFDLQMGWDFDFSNVESVQLAYEQFFDGTNYLDTNVELFSANAPSFTLAIDYEFLVSCVQGGVLAACLDSETNKGLQLYFDANTSSPQNARASLLWLNGDPKQVGKSAQRNIIVVRHREGSGGLTVYSFNGSNSTDVDRYDTTITVHAITGSAIPETTAKLCFGAIREDSGGSVSHGSFGKGWVHWAKLWKADLGDDACRKLAAWPHETLRLEYAGSDRQLYPGSLTRYASASFFANNPLPLKINYSNANYNTLSWNGSMMQEFFRSRVFAAFDYKWKSIITPVKVLTRESVTSPYCDPSVIESVYPPAVGEVYSYGSSSDYVYEHRGYLSGLFGGSNGFLRARWPGIILRDRGSIAGTRLIQQTTDPTYDGGFLLADGDVWYRPSNTPYFYVYISNETFEKHSMIGTRHLWDSADISKSYDGQGYWLRSEDWWTRSPSNQSSNSFMYRYYYYNSMYGMGYSGFATMLLGLSI